MYGSSKKARGDIQKVLLSLVRDEIRTFSKKPSYLRQELSQETIEKFSWGPMLDDIEAHMPLLTGVVRAGLTPTTQRERLQR